LELAIEAKATAKITADHLRGLRAVLEDHRKIKQRIIVCLERNTRRTEDGILILPATGFSNRLEAGDLF
jgi:hypothetical protein